MYSGPARRRPALAAGRGHAERGPQGEGLALGLSIADNLTLSRLTVSARASAGLPSRQAAARARWIERLGIRCAGPRQPVGELSGGNQQKVALARLLHHDVDVLLLDEPTRGIDVGSKAQIYALIDAARPRDWSRSERRSRWHLTAADTLLRGATAAVLMVSSYLPGAARLCDRIAVDVPRPAGTGATGIRMDGALTADGSVGRAAA